MPETQIPEMHEEHRQWMSEDAMWRDDVAIWQKEVVDALAELGKMERVFRDHATALDAHAKLIRREGAALRSHESALARFEQAGIDDRLKERACSHREHAAEHEQMREAHEEIKRCHRQMLERWLLMLEDRGAPPVEPK